MGTWLTGTSMVSTQGVEIVRSFDITLRYLARGMDEARGQKTNYQVFKVGSMLGIALRTDMWPQEALAIHRTPSPPATEGPEHSRARRRSPCPACPSLIRPTERLTHKTLEGGIRQFNLEISFGQPPDQKGA